MITLQPRPALAHGPDANGVIAIPLEHDGEVVGALEISADDDFDDALIQVLLQRLIIRLDPAQMPISGSADEYLSDRRINQILSQYTAAASVDELLRITLRELSETLGAEQASIRIGALVEPGAESNAASGDADAHPDTGNDGGEVQT